MTGSGLSAADIDFETTAPRAVEKLVQERTSADAGA
jgi:hypothetical protein